MLEGVSQKIVNSTPDLVRNYFKEGTTLKVSCFAVMFFGLLIAGGFYTLGKYLQNGSRESLYEVMNSNIDSYEGVSDDHKKLLKNRIKEVDPLTTKRQVFTPFKFSPALYKKALIEKTTYMELRNKEDATLNHGVNSFDFYFTYGMILLNSKTEFENKTEESRNHALKNLYPTTKPTNFKVAFGDLIEFALLNMKNIFNELSESHKGNPSMDENAMRERFASYMQKLGSSDLIPQDEFQKFALDFKLPEA